jgi:two-component SAPR family response regulator
LGGYNQEYGQEMLGQITHDLPFLGRVKEMAILTEAFTTTLENQGKCVLLSGEPGVGKSRLIDEYLLRENRTCIVIRAKVTQNTSHARDLFVGIVKFYLRRIHNAAHVITRVIDSSIYDEFAESIPELKIYYPYEAETTSTAVKPDINAILHTFLHNLVKFAPVILVIDDLHESSDDLLAMCKHMTQVVENIPVLCIFLSQPRTNIVEWSKTIKTQLITAIALPNLSEDEIGELNSLMFEGNINNGFFHWLHNRTRGVALFLREFICTLFEKGIIFFDNVDHRWRIMKTYSQIAIPDSVADMISTRLHSYSHEEYTFLSRASIIGFEFNPLSPLLKTSQDFLKSYVKSGLIIAKKNICSFTHPLIWEMIYNGIPLDERRGLHHEFGNYFLKHGDKESAVYQFLKAEVYNKRTVDILCELARKASDEGNFERCTYFLEIAYKTAKSIKIAPAKLVNILYLYAYALYTMGRYNASIELFKMMLRKNRNPQYVINMKTHAEVYRYMSQALAVTGKYRQAIKCANSGLRFVKKNNLRKSVDVLINLERSKAYAYKFMGHTKRALKIGETIRRRLRKTSNLYTIYQVYSLFGSVYDAEYEKTLAFRQKALDVAVRLQNETMIADAHGNLGMCYTNAGNFNQGRTHILHFQKYNIKAGRARQEVVAYMLLAYNYHHQGYLKRAEAEYLIGIKKAEEQKAYADLIWIEGFYSILLIQQERFGDANRHIDRAIELAQKYNMQDALFEYVIDKGLLLYASEDWEKVKPFMTMIKNEFKDRLQEGGLLSIFSGFYNITEGRIQQGLSEIDEGLRDHEHENYYPVLFRYAYICACLMEKNKHTRQYAAVYQKKAFEIASKLKMTGWLDRLSPRRKVSPPQCLRIYCFGRVMIENEHTGWSDVEQWQRTKLRQLFATIIMSVLKDERLSRERIGVLLWPELSTSKMANNFRVYLSLLRKKIGTNYIVYKNGICSMSNVWIDALEFKKLIHDAEAMLDQGKMHLAEMKLKEAADLYSGDLFENINGPGIDEVRAVFCSLHRRALLKLGDIHLNKLEFTDAINVGKRILSYDPYDEECHRFMMKSYHLSGEKAKAFKQYEICKELFKREFNCSPSDKTQKYYHAILNGDSS